MNSSNSENFVELSILSVPRGLNDPNYCHFLLGETEIVFALGNQNVQFHKKKEICRF